VVRARGRSARLLLPALVLDARPQCHGLVVRLRQDKDADATDAAEPAACPMRATVALEVNGRREHWLCRAHADIWFPLHMQYQNLKCFGSHSVVALARVAVQRRLQSADYSIPALIERLQALRDLREQVQLLFFRNVPANDAHWIHLRELDALLHALQRARPLALVAAPDATCTTLTTTTTTTTTSMVTAVCTTIIDGELTLEEQASADEQEAEQEAADEQEDADQQEAEQEAEADEQHDNEGKLAADDCLSAHGAPSEPAPALCPFELQIGASRLRAATLSELVALRARRVFDLFLLLQSNILNGDLARCGVERPHALVLEMCGFEMTGCVHAHSESRARRRRITSDASALIDQLELAIAPALYQVLYALHALCVSSLRRLADERTRLGPLLQRHLRRRAARLHDAEDSDAIIELARDVAANVQSEHFCVDDDDDESEDYQYTQIFAIMINDAMIRKFSTQLMQTIRRAHTVAGDPFAIVFRAASLLDSCTQPFAQTHYAAFCGHNVAISAARELDGARLQDEHVSLFAITADKAQRYARTACKPLLTALLIVHAVLNVHKPAARALELVSARAFCVPRPFAYVGARATWPACVSSALAAAHTRMQRPTADLPPV